MDIIFMGAVIFICFYIIYFVISAAVEQGTMKALIRYEKLKKQESKGTEGNS